VAVGARVFVTGSLSGTYAQFTLCAAELVHDLPDTISFAQGAALNVPYRTAYRALFQRVRVRPGQWVLVHGATGSVGLAAVQLALAAGFRVIGSAGTQEGAQLLRDQGVAHSASFGVFCV
jgi:NADPH2:quinone reductase